MMGKIQKVSLLLALCLTSVFAQLIKQDYNFGRITGGAFLSNTTVADQVDGWLGVVPVTTLQLGVPGTFQVKASLSNPYQNNLDHQGLYDYQAIGVFPDDLSATISPIQGQVFDLEVISSLLSFKRGHSEFDLQDSMVNAKVSNWSNLLFTHRMLTNRGNISINSFDYSQAFIRGPQLMAGQYRHEFSAKKYSAGGDGHSESLSWHPSYGLTSFLSLHAGVDRWSAGPQGWPSDFQARLDFHLPNFWLGTNWMVNTEDPIRLSTSGSRGSIYAGAITTREDINFSNVYGNWDSFFYPILGSGQLLVWGEYLPDAEHMTDLEGYVSAMYGVLKPLTVGVNLENDVFHSGTTEEQELKLRLQMNFSTIPMRTDGPSGIQPVQYLWGFVPGAGELRILSYASLNLLGSSTQKGYNSSDARGFSLLQDNPSHFSQNTPQIVGMPTVQVQSLVGITSHLFVDCTYQYFQDGVNSFSSWVPDTTAAHTVQASFGIAFENTVAQAGLTLVANQHTEPGPAYLRIVSKIP
jgi:hypothetical protein